MENKKNIIEEMQLTDNEDDIKVEDNKIEIKNKITTELKKKNVYSIEKKLQLLDLADLESDHYVENQFGIDRKNLRRWRKQKDTLLSIDNKNKARIPGGGRKTFLSEEEQSNIINWIKQNRDLKISITTFAIGLYIQKIKPSFKEKNLHAQQQLIYRFLHRNGYVFRKPSHLGQILPQNYSDLFLAFQKK